MSGNGRIACTALRMATVSQTVANDAPRPRRELRHRRPTSKLSRATGAWEAGAKTLRVARNTRSSIDWNSSDRKRCLSTPPTQRAPVHGVARCGNSDCRLCATCVAFTCKTHAIARTLVQKKRFATRTKVENRNSITREIQILKTERAKSRENSSHTESGPGTPTLKGNAIEQMPEPERPEKLTARTKTHRGAPRDQKVEHKAMTLADKTANRNPEADNSESNPMLTCPNMVTLDPNAAIDTDSGTSAIVITRGTEMRQSPTNNACRKGAKPTALDGQKRNTTSAAEGRYAAVAEPQDERGATNTTNRGIVTRTLIATAIGSTTHPTQHTARLDIQQRSLELMADQRIPP